MKQVFINEQPIELYKLLKFEGLATSGAEAKSIIANGEVRLNGKIELQKRKKIISGDVIEMRDEKMQIQIAKK